MIIDRDIAPYIVSADETIARAVGKIAESRQSIVCCVDEHGVMVGLFTNGDFLRWLAGRGRVDLEQPVSEILNRQFLSAAPDDSAQKI
ncbi:MAG TPA: CBS domain-containing protein, partial [Thermoanaerobaculia bacterium]|nr:CBS domain-containing protein [Thermoanaerobaculia bacterium]